MAEVSNVTNQVQSSVTNMPSTNEPSASVQPGMNVGAVATDVQSRVSVVGELFRFLWARKLWWLIPMIIALFVFGALIILGASGVLSPFIYTLF